MKFTRIAFVATLLTACVSAQADYFGTASGRSADPAKSPKISIEPTASVAGDYQNIGARINFTINDSITLYGDIGRSERFFSSGTSFGGGLFYYLPTLSESIDFLSTMDVAVQGSFHLARHETFGIERNSNTFGAALLVSPKTPLNDNGLTWYANAGLTRLPDYYASRSLVGGASSIEPHVGGGIYMPLGPGTFYAGGDIIDEIIASVGYRIKIK